MLKIKTILCLALIFASLSGCKKDEENMLMPGDATIGDPYNFPYMSIGEYTVELLSGSGQPAIPGVQLPEPLIFRVINQDNQPVAGIPVSWETQDGSISNATTVTDAEGKAQANWTPEIDPELSSNGAYWLSLSVMAKLTIHPDIEVTGSSWFSTTFNAQEVAGGNNESNTGNYLKSPEGVTVSPSGILFVADTKNNRIMVRKPGQSLYKFQSNLNSYPYNYSMPEGVFSDVTGTIYVADTGNDRILKYVHSFSLPGSYSSGITVVGGFNTGTTTAPRAVFVDLFDNIFVLERSNNRVMKFAPGATSGVVVAGGNGAGSAANQLDYPSGFYLDANGNIYIADTNNRRIQKWAPGATEGATVLGGFAEGSATEYKLEQPKGVWVDASENIFVADAAGRTKKWAPGATAGEIKGAGGDALWIDQQSNLFVTETQYHRVLKWAP